MTKAHWQTLIVIVIMAILPALSWLYMRNGANYRKSTLEEQFNRFDTLYSWIDTVTDSRKEYSVVYNVSEQTHQEVIVPLKKVFAQETERLAFIDLKDTTNTITPQMKLFLNAVDPSANVHLLRKNGVVYNSYNASAENAEELIFKHIAFVMPPKVRKKLIFKREGEK